MHRRSRHPDEECGNDEVTHEHDEGGFITVGSVVDEGSKHRPADTGDEVKGAAETPDSTLEPPAKVTGLNQGPNYHQAAPGESIHHAEPQVQLPRTASINQKRDSDRSAQ